MDIHSKVAKLIDIIEEYKSLLIYPDDLPESFVDIQKNIIYLEFLEEIKALEAISCISDTEEQKKQFIDSCRRRATDNENSFLSIFRNPKLITNEMYWKIMVRLFEPTTLSEAISILAPNISSAVTFEAYVKDVKLPALGTNIGFTFRQSSISEVDMRPLALERLSELVVCENVIFDTSNIELFNLGHHISFKESLTDYSPKMSDSLYQHNQSFRELNEDIAVVTGNGLSPRAALENLRAAFVLCSKEIQVASPKAKKGLDNFIHYVESLPGGFLSHFLACSEGIKYCPSTIQSIVEMEETTSRIYGTYAWGSPSGAAKLIDDILKNPENDIYLNQYPKPDPKDINVISRKYGTRHPIPLSSMDEKSTLPTRRLAYFNEYSPEILFGIQINHIDELADLLLSLPIDMYKSLFDNADFNCFYDEEMERYYLSKDFALFLQSGKLNRTQKETVFKCMMSERFPISKRRCLDFAWNKCDEDISYMIEEVPQDERVKLLTKPIYDEYSGALIENLGVNRPKELQIRLFSSIFRLLTEEQRVELFTTNMFHGSANPTQTFFDSSAFGSPFLIKIALASLEKRNRVRVIREAKDSIFSIATSAEAFLYILELFTPAELLELIRGKDIYDRTIFSRADSSLFGILVNLYPESEMPDVILHGLSHDRCIVEEIYFSSTNYKKLSDFILSVPVSMRMLIINYVLFEVVFDIDDNTNLFREIFNLIPESERLETISSPIYRHSGSHISILTYFIENNKLDCLNIVLESIPWKDILIILKKEDEDSSLLIDKVLNKPSSFKMILNKVPEKSRLDFIVEKEASCKSILEKSINDIELLRIILESLPTKDRYSLLLVECAAEEQTLLQIIKGRPEHIDGLKEYFDTDILKLAVKNYIASRDSEPDESFIGSYVVFFSGGYQKADKLSAARKLLDILDGKETTLNEVEKGALQNGNLQKVIHDIELISGIDIKELLGISSKAFEGEALSSLPDKPGFFS